MNEQIEKKATVGSLIQKSKSIAIIPSKLNGKDAFFAGIAIFHMLKEYDNKDVFLLYPGKIPDEAKGLISSSDVVQAIKERSLLVSIDYSGTDATNVHYTTEDDILHLKISPVPANFDRHSKIRSELTGHNYDLLIIVGAPDQDELGWDLENLGISLDDVKIINIDNSSENVEFGDVNVLNNDASSISLLVLQKASDWGLIIVEKSAKSLLKGITYNEPQYRG